MRTWIALLLPILFLQGCSEFVVETNDRALPVIGESNEFGAAVGTFPVTEYLVTGRTGPLTRNDEAAVLSHLRGICADRGEDFELSPLREPVYQGADVAWSVIGECTAPSD